jgi:multicomponent Na+:H+ antiporter subunit C
MTAHFVPLLMAAGLTACGVYMLLERNLTRMLLGLMMIGNAVNLLLIDVGGPDGNPPIYWASAGKENDADPLAQAMVLTAIVITMGIGAFVLALTYRSYNLTTTDDVGDDEEATRVSQLSDEEVIAAEPDQGVPVPAGELDAVPESEESR